MRLAAPRIEPIDSNRLDPAAQAALELLAEPSRGFNIFQTLARAPAALGAFLGWGSYVLSKRNSLSERNREIAILRVGVNCGSGYEFAQHRVIGLSCGITEAEIEAIKLGPDAPGWSPIERAILVACDELTRDHFVSSQSWIALESLGDRGRMDLVFTVGQYTQVSMMLNSFGVQLDPGLMLDPALDRRGLPQAD
jgi:alkylhydroperoxidase family enzyme